MTTVSICLDLLREAVSRRWFLGFGLAVTAVLVTLGLSLQMEVLDGALAATRLFGKVMSTEVRSVDVALRPLFRATAYLTFYGGVLFGILACADFGPSLMSPGRIEHLLSLPVRRWELLTGTFVGVLCLSGAGAMYGAGGLCLILGVKTGHWTAMPIVAALLASVAFASLYAAMLTAAVFVRSAALSAAVGLLLLLLGIVSSYREQVAPMFEDGWGRSAFRGASLFVPRLAALADAGADLAASAPVESQTLTAILAGIVAFAAAVLFLGIWRFEEKDF